MSAESVGPQPAPVDTDPPASSLQLVTASSRADKLSPVEEICLSFGPFQTAELRRCFSSFLMHYDGSLLLLYALFKLRFNTKDGGESVSHCWTFPLSLPHILLALSYSASQRSEPALMCSGSVSITPDLLSTPSILLEGFRLNLNCVLSPKFQKLKVFSMVGPKYLSLWVFVRCVGNQYFILGFWFCLRTFFGLEPKTKSSVQFSGLLVNVLMRFSWFKS